MKKIRLLAVFLLIVIIVCSCGQNNGREPEEKPEDSQNQGAKLKTLDEEPQISLFMHETEEIKELGLEEYIVGVVAAEMEPAWPQEALAAQAILARTFTMERMESTGGVPERGTDASTDVEEFQAYDESRINDTVRKAVEDTRGEVAVYNGKLIKAWFFADGGGITAASAMEGLTYDKEPTPYIQSVEDPGSAQAPAENQAWEARFSLKDARNKLRDYTGTDPGQIKNVSIEEKGPSGRITNVKIGSLTTSGPTLRLALGSTEMRSTLVSDLAVEGDQLVVAGKGFGHGVGMSQWGAKALADQGKTGEEIIQYFFKDVSVEALYE
jgi:stage II sporulation protein D